MDKTLSDEALEARLYRPALPRSSHQLAPDFVLVHHELKRPGVTLMLLWEEYARDNPQAYKHTSFCVKYRGFAQSLKRSMRQTHVAGEKLFADLAGTTVPIVDAATGEISQAQIFVATLGVSNYTFACATPRHTTGDWIGGQVQALKFIGGAPARRHRGWSATRSQQQYFVLPSPSAQAQAEPRERGSVPIASASIYTSSGATAPARPGVAAQLPLL